jgi:hypothetical protein
MSAITTTPRRPAVMVTHAPSPGPLGAPEISDDRLLEENVRLVRRISQLRGALEAAGRDNADLRRRLARARQENDQLRHPTPTPVGEYRRDCRDALAEPWSRNP